MHRFRYVLSILACCVAAATSLSAQTATLRGTVTDSASQESLQGASVSLVGTDLRAETNGSGQYALTGAPTGPATVRVQMIGYAPVERGVTLEAGGRRFSISRFRRARSGWRRWSRWATAARRGASSARRFPR